MKDFKLRVGSLADGPDLQKAMENLTNGAWPPFLYHAPVPAAYWDTIHRVFPTYQRLFYDDDRLIACANMVPLRFDLKFVDLPPEGLEWGQRISIEGAKAGIIPNMAMGFQIVIDPDYRGRGISPLAVSEMKRFAARNGLSHVLLPVRPTWKEHYPHMAMEDYIRWNRDDGLPHDPWLRVHVRLGALMIGPCPLSTIVPGSVAQWQGWAGQKFPTSGRYAIPGGLAPLEVDLDAGTALYIEPNVWMVHATGD